MEDMFEEFIEEVESPVEETVETESFMTETGKLAIMGAVIGAATAVGMLAIPVIVDLGAKVGNKARTFFSRNKTVIEDVPVEEAE